MQGLLQSAIILAFLFNFAAAFLKCQNFLRNEKN